MLVSVVCWYSLEPSVCWEDSEPPSAEFVMGSHNMKVGAVVGTEPEGPVLKSLFVRSNAELHSSDIEGLGTGLTAFESSAPIKEAIERNVDCASLVLRWLRAASDDAELDVNALARRSKVEVSDTEARVLRSIPDLPEQILRQDFRPTLGHGEFRKAAERCADQDPPPLALELLLEADASYLRLDYRLCVLLSALAADAGLYCLLKQALRSEAAIRTLKDSNVLGRREKDELEKKLAKGDLIGATKWVENWLEHATLGPRVGAAKALDLEGNLQDGILDEIGELNKKRNEVVHPRVWLRKGKGEAHKARSLARRFLQLSGQLSK